MKIWNVDNSGLCLSQLWTVFYYNGENATMSDFMPMFAVLHVAICVSACWVGSRGAVNNSWNRKDDIETVGVFIQPHLWFCFIISLPSSLSLMRNKGPRGSARNPQRENLSGTVTGEKTCRIIDPIVFHIPLVLRELFSRHTEATLKHFGWKYGPSDFDV